MGDNVRPAASRRQEGWARLAATALVVTILVLTLWPMPEEAYRVSLLPVTCLVCGEQGMQDVLQNIVMTLPLGMALVLSGLRPRPAMLAVFALSFTIESLQYFVVPGRDASLSDVITNTTGGILGALMAPYLGTLALPDRRAAPRLAMGALAAWALVWAFGAWALGDDIGNGHWRGRFPGDLPDAPSFGGTPVDAAIDSVTLGAVPHTLPVSVEQRFARDSFTLAATIQVGAPLARRENIITIIDVRQDTGQANNNMVMLLNRAHTHGIIAYRMNAAPLKLRVPAFNLGTVFDVPPGRQVSLTVTRTRGELDAEVTSDGASSRVRFRLAPELAWGMFFARTPQVTLAWRVEAFVWAAAMLALAGYWAGRARRMRLLALLAAGAVVVQLVVPWWFPVAPQSALGWALLLAGLVTGFLVGLFLIPSPRTP